MMRILHVIQTLDPAAGGPPVVAARLAAAQAAAGHEVTIASYAAPDAREAVERALTQVPHFRGVRRHDLPPTAGAFDRMFARSTGRALEAVAAGQDVLHLHGVWDPVLRAAASVASARSTPYAVAAHGMLDPWSLSQSRLKKRLALALAYRHMLDNAAFVQALNDEERRLMKPLGLKSPVVVIPNGVFLEEFEQLPPPDTFRRSHPALGDAPYVLFLSRLHHKKGLDYLADAFALLARRRPELHLVVAGPDAGERASFERQVAGAGLSNKVHLVGPVYGGEKVAALAGAACLCLPSRQEGFSMAVTEAMACGLPVVISDACHFPEVAEAGAGEVTPLEPQAIADALDRVTSDPQRAKQMGEAGREMVRTRYTWPRIAEECVRAYEQAKRGITGITGITKPEARMTNQ